MSFNKFIILFIIFFIVIFLLEKYIIYCKISNTEHMTNNLNNLIISKEDAINHLSSFNNPSYLFNELFIKTDNINTKLSNLNIIKDEPLQKQLYSAISDIIYDHGIYNKMLWSIDDKPTIEFISNITVGRLQYIYNIDNYTNIDWTHTYLNINKSLIYDLYEILYYNKYNNNNNKPLITIKMLLSRHPILSSYQKEIITLIMNKYPYFNIDVILNSSKSNFNNSVIISRNYIINNLRFKDVDINFKESITNSIYNILFTIYPDNITVNQLLNGPGFFNYKETIITLLIDVLNKLIIYIRPNYDYNNYDNTVILLNTTLIDINNLLMDLEDIRDKIYLRQNIGVEKTDILINTLQNQLNSRFQDIFTRDTDNLLAHVRSVIYRRHINTPFDLIIKKIVKTSKISDIYIAILFGIF